MPCAVAPSTIRRSSVAMTTRCAPLACARSATRTTIGLPAMSASGLPGSRVEAQRAGIRAVNAIRGPPSSHAQLFVLLRRDLPCFLFEHHRNPVADRIRQSRRLGDQLLLVAIVNEGALGHRAHEH